MWHRRRRLPLTLATNLATTVPASHPTASVATPKPAAISRATFDAAVAPITAQPSSHSTGRASAPDLAPAAPRGPTAVALASTPAASCPPTPAAAAIASFAASLPSGLWTKPAAAFTAAAGIILAPVLSSCGRHRLVASG